MTLSELLKRVQAAVSYAEGYGQDTDEIPVQLQINDDNGCSVLAGEQVSVDYDNDINIPGCVISAEK